MAATISGAEWLRTLAGTTLVVKFGGNAMVDPALFDSFAADVVAMQRAGCRVAVVHGGGPQISAELSARGIASEFRAGLRVTTPDAIDAVRTALTAVGRELAAAITAAGGTAEALTGETRGLFAGRRTGAVVDGVEVDLGQVGEVTGVDTGLLEQFLDAGTVPVIASISPDAQVPGTSLNVNADTAAGAVAAALGADRLVMLTDVSGLYRAWPDPDTLVTRIDADELALLLPSLESGMIPKMRACLDAVLAGVAEAIIIDGRMPHALTAAPFGTAGTTVVPVPASVPAPASRAAEEATS